MLESFERNGAPWFAALDGNVWHAGIGDPTVIGWLTVVAYFFAATMCWAVVALKARRPVARDIFWFWLLFALGMTFLGINKQLDLQTWLTQFGRDVARSEGWYEYRRPVQAVFIVGITVGIGLTLRALFRISRRHRRETRPAAMGALVLSSFVLVRAASFHHVDQLLGLRFSGIRVNAILELTGILWVTLAAGGCWRRLRLEPPGATASTTGLPPGAPANH